jgi:hypothetical protein
MNRSLTFVFATVAGIADGLLTRYPGPPTALAQSQQPVANEIRAQSFTLVDGTHRTVGTFKVEGLNWIARLPQQQVNPTLQARIVLLDANGREIWSAGETAIRPLSQNIR